jgi:hypothetical protein
MGWVPLLLHPETQNVPSDSMKLCTNNHDTIVAISFPNCFLSTMTNTQEKDIIHEMLRLESMTIRKNSIDVAMHMHETQGGSCLTVLLLLQLSYYHQWESCYSAS